MIKKITIFPVNITILAIFSIPVTAVLFFIFILDMIFSPKQTICDLYEDILSLKNKLFN